MNVTIRGQGGGLSAFLEVLRGRFERGTPTQTGDAATYKSRRCGVRAGAGGNPRGFPLCSVGARRGGKATELPVNRGTILIQLMY
jgi:hypothetical protein